MCSTTFSVFLPYCFSWTVASFMSSTHSQSHIRTHIYTLEDRIHMRSNVFYLYFWAYVTSFNKFLLHSFSCKAHFSWIKFHRVHVHYIFTIHSSADGRLGGSPFLTIVVEQQHTWKCPWGRLKRILSLHPEGYSWVFPFFFLRILHTDFFSCGTSLCFHKQWSVFLFSHILFSAIVNWFGDNSHSGWPKMESQGSFVVVVLRQDLSSVWI